MSGFNREWLALREPADHRARDAGLAQAFAEHVVHAENITIVDFGSGTGSTVRALAPIMPPDQRWLLVDHDENLLAAARTALGDRETIAFQTADLRLLDTVPGGSDHAVTASALFDLTTHDFICTLISKIAAWGAPIYAALTYDGTMKWSVPHPLDEAVVAAFNAHQRSEKEFGQALGPAAGATLAAACAAAGMQVSTAQSPWRLGPDDAALQAAFIDGVAKAVAETGAVDADGLSQWLRFRLQAVTEPDSLCTVGHVDMLALPAQDEARKSQSKTMSEPMS